MKPIKLLCKKANGDTIDITKLIIDLNWSGDYKSCARKLEFSIVASSNDVNIPKVDIPLSSIIIFYENDIELFRGFVFDREKNSSSTSIRFTAFDYAERLNKIKVSYNFKNSSASSVFNKICNDYSIKKDSVASASSSFSKVFLNASIYETIMTAYTEEAKKNNKKYMVYAKGDSIGVKEKGKVTLSIKFEESKNLISSSFKESIQNMVNKVIIVDENGNKVSEVTDNEMLKIHGLFQEVYKKEENKDANIEANAMLKGIEQTCNLSGFGDTTCTTGNGVRIKDLYTGLVGLFYIDGDSHTWSGGNYTIELTLNFKNIMDEISSGQDEDESSSGSSDSDSNIDKTKESSNNNDKANKAVAFAKSKVGGKYVWGGTGNGGYDCSGLTMMAYKQVGISIPRTSKAQSTFGKSISKSQLQLGDLVFFDTKGGGYVSHVGMYIGDGKFVHASSPKSGIKINSLNESYYASRYTNARRVV